MKIFKEFLCFLTSVFFLFPQISVCGDGLDFNNSLSADSKEISEEQSEDKLKGFSAKSICVMECTTGTVLYEKNKDVQKCASHFAKLMTLYIAGEKIRNKELDFDENAVVSENANSQPSPQIWLDKGEKIPLSELIKAITVGNANDACVALGEKISGNEEKFVSLMNKKAKSLGMKSTYFADCTGISKQTVSTAGDMALLCEKLFDMDFFNDYFICWRDCVRKGKTELVNLNRLVRYYKGIRGFKFWGNSGAAGAQRGKMKICAVALDFETDEERDSLMKKLLDMAFENFRIYYPEIPQDFLKEITVTGGEENRVEVFSQNICGVIIPAGAGGDIKCDFKREEILAAPVKKEQNVGKFVCTLEGKEILQVDLYTKKEIPVMNVKCGLKKLWLNLLNLH